MSYENADFVFIGSKTGSGDITYDDTTSVSMEDILSVNTNIWLSVESFENTLSQLALETTDEICVLQKPILFTDTAYTIKQSTYHFNTSIENPSYPLSLFEYVNIFANTCPILILHRKNKGYIIVSHSSLLSNVSDNIKLIYEVLMQIYLMSYCHTKTMTSWITTSPIDFYLNKNCAFNKNHPIINLLKLIKQNNLDTTIPMDLIDVNTSDNVSYDHIDIRGNLYFKKIGGTADIEKASDAISIYSSSGAIIYYSETSPVIQTIEDSFHISYTQDDSYYYFTIPAFRSSTYKIWTENQTISILKDLSIDQYIVYIDRSDSKSLASIFNICPISEYDTSHEEYIQCATITVQRTYTLHTYDLRQPGGGEDSPVINYEMIDSGNILGRPYRIGSCLFIQLPSEYKPYKNMIEESIKRDMSSAEYPILVFKEG
jgi:soluble P-type ATPase